MNAGMRLPIAILVISFLSITGAADAAPSFDCNKASTRVEDMICDHPKIAELDSELAEAYRTALRDSPWTSANRRIRSEQKEWIARRNECETPRCLRRLYNQRIRELRAEVSGDGSQPPSAQSEDANEPETRTEQVRFASGESGAEFTDALAPGASINYVLGASKGQELYVRVDHLNGPRLDFQIFHPDGSLLMNMTPTDKPYEGELFLSGDHVIEVINRGGKTGEYSIVFEID